jgi:mono/diheme cytochrome c family protein
MKQVTIALAAALTFVATSARAEDAKALFAQKCASCHGANGKGDTAMAKKLGAKDLSTLTLSEAAIAGTITNGKPPKMMAYKDKLTGEQIQAIAKYVKGGLK